MNFDFPVKVVEHAQLFLLCVGVKNKINHAALLWLYWWKKTGNFTVKKKKISSHNDKISLDIPSYFRVA